MTRIKLEQGTEEGKRPRLHPCLDGWREESTNGV